MDRRARCSLSLLVLCALAGCPSPPPADAGSDATSADATTDAPRAPLFVARFAPQPAAPAPWPAPGSLPFPSDLYLEADGTIDDNLVDFSGLRLPDNGAVLSEALRDLDGFGRNAGALFVLDTPPATPTEPALELDAASLPSTGAASLGAESAAFAFDLDPALDAARARIPVVAGWHRAFHTVTVAPEGLALRPGHRYAFALTSGVRTQGANPVALAPSADFVALRDGDASARSSAAGLRYGPAVDRVLALLGPSFDRGRLVSLAVFTVQTRHRELRAAADAVRAGRVRPAPTLVTDSAAAQPYTVARFGASAHAGWTATLDEWLGTPLRGTDGRELPGEPWPDTEGPSVGMAHDALGAIFTATFEAPDYRGERGRLTLAADGAPVPVRATQRIPVTFALPRGPAPASGFPVLLWGHGLGNHRRSLLALANEMARRGIATVAIDHVTFGQRALPVDTTSLQNGTYRGPDGIGDSAEYPPADFFGNLQSMVVFRDNLRQAALDQVQLRRLVSNPALDLSFVAAEYGGAAPTLDRAHIAYAGDSLGGIIGTLFASIEPGVNPVVLNVPGGAFFTAVGADAPVLNSLLGFLPPVFGAPTSPMDRFHPVSQLLQLAVDSADPASLAAEVTAPPGGGRGHDVWVVASLWDEIIANRSTELLAREMQLPQLLPAALAVEGLPTASGALHGNLPGGATGAFFQLAPSTHGANIAGRYGVRTYAAPFPRAGSNRFPRVTTPYRIRQPVVAYQRAIAAFLASSFAGNSTLDASALDPRYDLDDDGFTRAQEAAANTSDDDPAARPPGAGTPRDVGF